MRKTPSECMIFAAGFGTRMRPLTNDRPKPLIEVAGTTLLDHTITMARQSVIESIVVNAHYKSEQIVDHLSSAPNTTVVVENPILDTGGGLKNAGSNFKNDFIFTSNSDNVWVGKNPFDVLKNAWNPNQSATLLCAPIALVQGRNGTGDFDIDTDGRIVRGKDFVFLGVQIISRRFVDSVSEMVFSLNTVWDSMIETGSLFGAVYEDVWCDVGRPENIPIAEELLGDRRV